MRYQGRITTWKDGKGFGFITPNDGDKQVFVHIKEFLNRQRRPVGNEIVSYDLKTDAQGRIQAESVGFIDEPMPSTGPSWPNNVSLLVAVIFLGFVAGSAFAGELPFAVLGLYLGTSTIAYVAYALDKSAARNNRWRTQESTLHLVGLIGGWPGALAAQRLLRHKSKKASFQVAFWATVVLNCGALGWLFFSSSGAGAIRLILGSP
jgi:uncharacterized membrane protein YsdA (DUF1294 family)/cold shock CspA family protein